MLLLSTLHAVQQRLGYVVRKLREYQKWLFAGKTTITIARAPLHDASNQGHTLLILTLTLSTHTVEQRLGYVVRMKGVPIGRLLL